METFALLNGKPTRLSDAKVSVLDRGFLFGDGVYEVVRVYGGKPFLFDAHLDRFHRSLEGLRIHGVDIGRLKSDLLQLLASSRLLEAVLYWQATRGAAAVRSHAFPAAAVPTELAYVQPFDDTYSEKRRVGCSAILVPDQRWGRCDLKTVNLLGNVLAAQAAKDAGAYEAIQFKPDGTITEGSHTSVWAVKDGVLRLPPLSPSVLPGITRALTLKLAGELGLPVEERPVSTHELESLSEVFLTSTGTEVMAVTVIDGKNVADGLPGPLTRRLQTAYENEVLRFQNLFVAPPPPHPVSPEPINASR